MTVSTYRADTATTAPAPAGTEPVAAAAQPGCPACPHPLAEHDAIAGRFCRATVAGAFHRGCVCRTG